MLWKVPIIQLVFHVFLKHDLHLAEQDSKQTVSLEKDHVFFGTRGIHSYVHGRAKECWFKKKIKTPTCVYTWKSDVDV